MATTPLAVLDLVPISSGSTAAEALRNSIDLAQAAERFGYARYWFAEHHLNPGVAGTSPAVVLALTAAATSTIRIGSGAVQMGHRTALSTVEEFGLIDALHPGRLDLGLGRSGRAGAPGPRPRAGDGRRGRPGTGGRRTGCSSRRGSLEHLLGSPRFALQKSCCSCPAPVAGLHRAGRRHPGAAARHLPLGRRRRGARHPGRGRGRPGVDPGQQRRGERPGGRGERAAVRGQLPRQPGDGAGGRRGLPGRVPALRRPRPALRQRLRRRRRRRATRRPRGSSPPATACGFAASGRARARSRSPPRRRRARTRWTDEDRALVADRVDTQFVGSPRQVAGQLEQLRDATGADELIITTITHDHADRVRSYQLLAEEWHRRCTTNA